jgi:hypothetical protein
MTWWLTHTVIYFADLMTAIGVSIILTLICLFMPGLRL